MFTHKPSGLLKTPMDKTTSRLNAVLGALTADAAALGLHWLYDTDRLAQVAGDQVVFRQPRIKDYADLGFVPTLFFPVRRLKARKQAFQSSRTLREHQLRFSSAATAATVSADRVPEGEKSPQPFNQASSDPSFLSWRSTWWVSHLKAPPRHQYL